MHRLEKNETAAEFLGMSGPFHWWLPLSYDDGIGHVSAGKTGIGDRYQEKAETEGVPRNVFR
jgi:hypothetical protein